LKGGIKIKYEDINNVLNFLNITDQYILLKDKGKVKKVYIYEIEPVTFLNFSIDVQSNILNLYSEFLRELNLEFQIYISNKKINTEKYIKNFYTCIKKEGNKKYIEIVRNYIADITKGLENEDIYITKFYIVVSFPTENDRKIEVIDNIINRLGQIGCHISRIMSKSKLKYLLYESINKEKIT